jgi:MOSC domain-containing protein YiiM
MPTIVSIQTGKAAAYRHPNQADGNGREWTTAFFKTLVDGPVRVASLGVAGDEQADRENHGGPDKAVLAYSADHYPYWREHLSLADMPHGGFGENLTIGGLTEETVCIGDTWRAGEVCFQVTQPRQPCWKMSRRWNLPDLAKQVVVNGKSGWYLRVLQEGELQADAAIELVSRPHPTWSVARASRVMHHEKHDMALAAELVSLPELSAAWREALTARIAKRK